MDADPPALTVEAGYSKHRRKGTVPVHPELTSLLRAWIEFRPADALLWSGKWAKNHYAADLLRHDLTAARATWIAEADTAEERERREQSDFLAYEDASGGKADFHALRHKFITELVKAGVQPKDAKELARHSTITLTMDRYAHVTLQDTAAALSKLSGPPPTGGLAGAAPGAADGGNGREGSGTVEERRTPSKTGAAKGRKGAQPLRLQVLEDDREGLRTPRKAEGEGFEPSVRTGPTPVFKTGALNRSATPPAWRSR